MKTHWFGSLNLLVILALFLPSVRTTGAVQAQPPIPPATAGTLDPMQVQTALDDIPIMFGEDTWPLAEELAQATPTTDAQNVELVGHIGGATYAVAVQGDYDYIGEGPRLTILNISNPASPTVLGKTTPLPSVVQVRPVRPDAAGVSAPHPAGPLVNRW